MRKEYPQIKSIKQESYLEMTAHAVESVSKTSSQFSVTDTYWPNMWHLHPDRKPNMGVYNAWCRGYTGKGVTLGFIDHGIDLSQTDLQRNYVPELAYDYLDDDDDPLMNYTADESSHGTNCAGIAAAEKSNNHCIVGIAYEAKFTNLRILDNHLAATYSDYALAFTHRLDDIDVYSNSWGQLDRSSGFPETLTVITNAFRAGVYNGRGGKGVIYTFSSGNGGALYDCNLDIFNSNIYTIAVNSVAYNGSPADYAESCTAIMTSAYGGSSGSEGGITTTDSNNVCTTTFAGTSAACPMVTGIIALTLQVNPELTWRDIQHLIVETATTSGLKDGSFVTNGSGRNVSLFFGFGLINADAMVHKAMTWKTVPKLWYNTAHSFVNRQSYIYNIWSTSIFRSNISHTEKVRVWIKFRASNSASVNFNLLSPSGTVNRLLRGQIYGSSRNTTWTSVTVHCWGENPNGNWTLSMASRGVYAVHYLYEWKLYVYGTLSDPLQDKQKDGHLGSSCNEASCRQPHSVCHDKSKICVCEDGYSNINGYCIKDGDIGATCERTKHCTDENSICSNITDTCECKIGYRALNSKCIKDGEYGGKCLMNGTCTGSDIVCDTYLETCVKCSSNSHKFKNKCMKDGFIGGKCLSNSSCFDDGAFCDSSNYTCAICPRYHTAIDGNCIKDGSLGGYCNRYRFSTVTCYTPHTHCNRTTYKCECRSGLNESTGACKNVGFVGGQCLSDSSCFDYGAYCDSSNNTCIICPRYHRVIDGNCVKDGSLGGYCNRYRYSTVTCYTPHTHCNGTTYKCECRSGLNKSTGACKNVGFVGGQCLSDSSCFDYGAYCDSSNNTCIICPRYHSVIDGNCVKDGSLGGYCRFSRICYTPYTHCNRTTYKCECRSSLNKSTGSCKNVGFVGGQCLSDSSCFDDGAYCDSSNNTCGICPRPHSVIGGNCVEDGSLGGYCHWLIICYEPHTRCDHTTNKCECRSGYNKSNGSCKRAGNVGGKCVSNRICFADDAFCDSSNNTCVICPRYHTGIDGHCVKHGEIGGWCLQNGTCSSINTFCNKRNNTCVNCPQKQHVIDGKCRRDGSLGGYCIYSCNSMRTVCNGRTNRCECRRLYKKSGRKCVRIADGQPGGRCLSNRTCGPWNTVCNTFNNTCETCHKYHRWINGKCVKDGTSGGKCLHNNTCTESSTVCSITNNTCIRCPEKHRVNKGKCVRDDETDEMCLLNQTCVEVNTICDITRNICVKNSNTHREVDKKIVSLGTLAIQVIASIAAMAGVIVIMHYTCFRGRNGHLHNRPVHV
ncbi:proprotein convertase subtilisin/kexin type 6-like isoform X2 [Mercenaria mercenaria]|uniref:proprotein convertase subtilisin/kexin type 6-like isoform X2 n=1 Tax=Mercenaria mercenaria TaxID=6596 RepID=UPI00234E5E45|nr:proprotein convertase subtilisin/kexin type 6-like isoform X2 [Mercenaria mercenaria]